MQIDTLAGKLELNGELGCWTAEASVSSPADGVQLVTFVFNTPDKSTPPRFSLRMSLPANDIQVRWHPLAVYGAFIPPDWASAVDSNLASNMPLMSLFNTAGENRLTFAVSEALRTVRTFCGINEEQCAVSVRIEFFTVPEAPLSHYSFTLRLDRRAVFYAAAVTAASAWFAEMPAYRPSTPPAAAYAPLYSSWYNFHKELFAEEIEAECARAAEYGMKTIIIDDGWQDDGSQRGYAYCGDWEISQRRFPDMRAHVAKIHDLGMKYMVWYAVPFIGCKSKNAQRFQGKYLGKIDSLDTYVLDPRFAEVREFLINIYETAMREWDIDGFKLDFIDCFRLFGDDPAAAENYAGRDFDTVPEGVDALLSEVMTRLRALKPEVLIEFRQTYIGPAIRKFGNMLRVGDCPADALRNRVCSLNLRLTSGDTAVHSDMIEFNVEEPAEASALQLLNIIFSVPQISVRLDRITPEQQMMLRFWLQFCTANADTLLRGTLRPEHPEMNYPLVAAAGADDEVIAVYQSGQTACLAAGLKTHYLVNAANCGELIIDSPVKMQAEIFDACGRRQPDAAFGPGIVRIAVPRAGLVIAR